MNGRCISGSPLGLSGGLALLLLTGCVPKPDLVAAPPSKAVAAPVRAPVGAPQMPMATAVPRALLPDAISGPPVGLDSAITALGSGFNGTVGIAVRDVQAGWTVAYNGGLAFPQQSVSKLWVAITLLDAVDRGELSLDEQLLIGPRDFTVFHQPIRALVGAGGYRTSYRSLLSLAMTQSDNTANDLLLRRAGGPDAVRAMFLRKGLAGIAFGPGERLLQSRIAGLEWRPEYALGGAFYQARAALPMQVRSEAMRRYLADPMDGAQPVGIVAALSRLRRGELLSIASTHYLLGLMSSSRTGPQRLRGGLSPDWSFAHKTGTGQELGGLATGYNDVGLLTSPDGRSYAVAVMIGSTRRGIPERQRLMQDVTRAVIARSIRPAYATAIGG
ncbi:serine hydrolase [Sphingomonas oleivorans]|uniref:beta-lactamase n=1 Tax=Sphingomonas oleivorans TaxID=1735121 RepID=A0A2T5FYC2_9SPHN|nr:serine hydrolase [Sphingomonas oleivorans]PTQ11512.1 serine hydrolase [Sphingomonas oleivorans]